MTGYWCELDHTADLAVKVYGSNLEALFTAAAQALFELAFEPASQQASRQFSVNLAAPDVETLLVDWLNELLYLSEIHGVYFTKFSFLTILPTKLSANLDALKLSATKQVIKAATFHNISIDERNDGLHTTVVFDI
jgi:SHS2 domain-containing protein